jgi:hypothetical protein
MACYDFEYAVQTLRQAIDFAEVEHDFLPLRRWVNEVEASGHELGAMDTRLNLPAGQEFLLITMQSITTGSLSPEAAVQNICRWLNSGQIQILETELTHHYQIV